MCGICGQYNFRTGRPALEPDLRRMASSIAHRGPDDEGCFAEGPVGFGFRRLSIIDLAAGHQPMATADGGVVLVFNGEIFNYRELRAELIAAGRAFRTASDTEVVLQAYAEWGMDFLSRLRGMFGLAVWDGRRKRLVLARDRFGVKGLYYRLDGEGLLFGSEIRPILSALGASPGVDAAAVKLFLKYRYTPAPLTAFSGIRKLAAGECLVVEAGREKIFRYYRRPPGAVDRGIPSTGPPRSLPGSTAKRSVASSWPTSPSGSS
jgi:asparagine synthase (glutamine-hydrolysing)